MTTAYTSLLGLALPVTGELSGTWGDMVNNSITSLLDSAVAGTTTISSDADVTLSTTTGAANTSREAILLWTAGGTVTRNITAPAQSKAYIVINASSSTQSIVLRGAGPTTGVTIIKGEAAVCAWNGSDFIKVSNISGAGVFSSLTVTGTTTLSGLTASTALALDASKNAVSVTNTGTGNNVLATSPTITTPTISSLTSAVATALTLQSAGTTAVTVDTSQNVGIGTTSPDSSNKLQVAGDFAVSWDANKFIGMKFASGTSYKMGLVLNNTTRECKVWSQSSDSDDKITFYTGPTPSERMRIDSSGNLLSANGTIQFTSAQYRSNVASSQLQFINNSAGVSLAVNGTSWGSLSDERDKEIIEPIADATSKVASLRSVIGRYKVDDADKRRAFLIAQDVKAVLPEAVTELEDEQKTLILQYTEVIPLLVAAIQELKAEFDAYKAAHP
jgi:hypothetical protein